jgi:hypothetical protein
MSKVLEPSFADLREHKTLYTKFFQDTFIRSFVTDFKYLGSIKASDGTCTKDIKCRIGMVKQKMVQLNNIWKDNGVPREPKIRSFPNLFHLFLFVENIDFLAL